MKYWGILSTWSGEKPVSVWNKSNKSWIYQKFVIENQYIYHGGYTSTAVKGCLKESPGRLDDLVVTIRLLFWVSDTDFQSIFLSYEVLFSDRLVDVYKDNVNLMRGLWGFHQQDLLSESPKAPYLNYFCLLNCIYK